MPPERRRGGGSNHSAQPRSVLVSKALSRLLRHAAVQERIPIDSHGYVRMDHLLAWQRLRSMKPPVTMEEVVDVVRENEKKRFALKVVPKEGPGEARGEAEEEPAVATGEEAEARTETETQRAISAFQLMEEGKESLDLKSFFIRATQGHSMKTIEAENLLTPISLYDPASIPDTVVHGTFYGAWDRILASGGLKSMGRNHVHFASGPALDEVLPKTRGGEEQKENEKTESSLGSLLGKNKVISGMRSDAQILVYIDVRRALMEENGMKWWKSENGVILTDGVAAPSSSPGIDEEGDRETEKVVPTEYFLAAVEIKAGLGLIWEHGQGTVQELPERLRTRSIPRGKGGGPRTKGQSGGRRG